MVLVGSTHIEPVTIDWRIQINNDAQGAIGQLAHAPPPNFTIVRSTFSMSTQGMVLFSYLPMRRHAMPNMHPGAQQPHGWMVGGGAGAGGGVGGIGGVGYGPGPMSGMPGMPGMMGPQGVGQPPPSATSMPTHMPMGSGRMQVGGDAMDGRPPMVTE